MNSTLYTINYRPLFNYSSSSLLYAAGSIIEILESYEEDMDDFIKDSFKKDIVVILDEIAQRN